MNLGVGVKGGSGGGGMAEMGGLVSHRPDMGKDKCALSF